jgi:hypothetical protein
MGLGLEEDCVIVGKYLKKSHVMILSFICVWLTFLQEQMKSKLK